MKKANKFSIIIFIFSAILIVLDIIISCKSDGFLRIVINYAAVPIAAIFALLKSHKSYWILFGYELLVSLLILHDLLGISIFTYFYLPDAWQFFNNLTITPSIFGLPDWLQPIIAFISASVLAVIAKSVLSYKFRKE